MEKKKDKKLDRDMRNLILFIMFVLIIFRLRMARKEIDDQVRVMNHYFIIREQYM